jgi:hypothetical protein
MYRGPNGTTITALRTAGAYTIRINDADDVQIGMLRDIADVPRGLLLAEGYVSGYYAGMLAGNRELYRGVCGLLGVAPAPETLAAFENRLAEPNGLPPYGGECDAGDQRRANAFAD